jgi:hypothetical protein
MKTILNTPVLIAVSAIALSLGVFMVTQAAADIQQITVCVNNAGGMRLKGGILGNCHKNETELSWNQQGLKGDTGAKGEKGDQGIQGVQGEKGDKGDNADQGLQGETGEKGDKGEPGISPSHGAGNIAFMSQYYNGLLVLLKTDGTVWVVNKGNAPFTRIIGNGDGIGNVPVPVSDIVEWGYSTLIDKDGNFWIINPDDVQAGWHNLGQLP